MLPRHRYPHRNGTTTAYWSEPEVAAAYRDRFTGMQDRAERIERYEQDLAQVLDTTKRTFLIVSLLPDRSGTMQIDAHTADAFNREVLGQQPMIMGTSRTWMRTRVGPRRLFASTSSVNRETESQFACELHADGGGALANPVSERRDQFGAPSEGSLLGDETLVLGILSSLRFLGRHARDRAATTGTAVVRATICPASTEAPANLIFERGDFDDAARERTVRSTPVANAVADIDLLAEDGPELVAAAYRLASDLFQEFGLAEAIQLTREEALRRRYWSQRARPQLETWAEQAGIEWVDETVPL
ncbi:hypothetical protein NI17_007305 [Thermobifida halotolerans]|uniref:Uncharacterized protein n=1 Tax=Thermobifida halotolerans TaxID=483545 RepID=A0A399G4J4_9ACTN|nr:hypothetical protein [Thermobifida halotolerans]UOE20965.1 hypothetical protein NI17_007305 [Thermobifida halotolerans]